MYGVFKDSHSHTCIRVQVGHKWTKYVPMASDELRIHRQLTKDFEHEWTPMPQYDVRRAAQLYLFQKDCHKTVSNEARSHLERLAAGQVAVPQPETDEEEVMATKKEAPAKKAAAKKAAPKAAAAKKEAPAKKAAAKKDAPTKSGPGRTPNIDGSAKITVKVAENPKRGGAAERFALYKTGMTVDQYMAAGGKRADVNWDVRQGFIAVAN